MEFKNFLDTSCDDELTKINGLTWLPWIGKNYSNNQRRLLIVGESHYCKADNEEDFKKECKAKIGNKENTRIVVNNEAIIREIKKDCRYFDNTYKALLNENTFKALIKDITFRERFWGQVCFYNFIQRPMDYRIKERPKRTDFYNAWKLFIDLITIINPTDCIVTGVQASNSFNHAMNDLNINFSKVKKVEKVGMVYPRTALLNINENEIKLSFMQHPSAWFSWENWHIFLENEHKEGLKALRQ